MTHWLSFAIVTSIHSGFPDLFITVILSTAMKIPTQYQFAYKVSDILKEMSSFKL